jgi:tripartite-type tricarboxylate transporter receptor subunit TctC
MFPFAAGGSTAVFLRMAAERVGTSIGEPAVIENVAGACGTISIV